MKIYTSIFKENSRLLLNAFEKGHQLRESIYFDFKKSYAYLFTQKSYTRAVLLWEKESSEEIIENFLVPVESFFAICSCYDFIFYKNGVFSYQGETFEFPSLKENPDVSIFDKLDIAKLKFFDKKGFFNESVSFASGDDQSNLNGVFIKNNRILASNRTKFFEFELGYDLPDISISLSLAKLLASDLDSITKYSILGDLIHFNFNDKIDIIFSGNKNLSIPDSTSEDFVLMYNHPFNFILNRNDTINFLKTFKPFLKDVPNQRILCKLVLADGKKDEGELIINVVDINKIKKSIKIPYISQEIINIEFYISYTYLMDALLNINSEYIKVQVSKESPAINFTAFDFLNKNNFNKNDYPHIVLVQLKD